jgi:hypothetical protein
MLSADDDKPVGKSGQRNRKTEQSGKTGQRSRKSAQKQSTKPAQLDSAQEQSAKEQSAQMPVAQEPVAQEPVAQELVVQQQANEQASTPIASSESDAQVSAPVTSTESYSIESALTDTDQVGSVASADQLRVAQEQVKEQVKDEVSAPLVLRESSPASGTRANTDQVGSVVSVGSVASSPVVPVSFQSLAKAYEDYARKSLDQARVLFEKLAHVRSLDKALELQTDFVKHACETFMTDSQKILDLHQGLARQRFSYLEGIVAMMAPIAFIPRALRN